MAIAATTSVTLSIGEWIEVLNRLSVPGRRTVPHSNLRWLIIGAYDRSWFGKQSSEQAELFLTAEEQAAFDLYVSLGNVPADTLRGIQEFRQRAPPTTTATQA